MSLTLVLEEALQELKQNTILHKMQNVNSTPHRFGPAALANVKPLNNRIGGRSVWSYPNTQSLNKLVLVGYAEYQDKAKTIIKYIDKDAIEADFKRKAAAYDRMKRLEPDAVFEDIMLVDPLDLTEEQLLNLDSDNLKMLYDNLLHMIFGSMAEIEELESEYESLQSHVENVKSRL